MGNSGNAVPADNHPTCTAISVESSAQLKEKVIETDSMAGADGTVFPADKGQQLDPTSEMEERRLSIIFLFFSSSLF